MMLRMTYRVETDMFELWAWDGHGERPTQPVLAFSGRHKESLTELVDTLWGLGARPTGERYYNDHVAAMKEHLTDLRDIARHALKMEPKE